MLPSLNRHLTITFTLVVIGFVVQGQRYNFVKYSIENGLALPEIYDLCQDSKGNLWMATYGGGISKFDGESFVNFTEKEGLCHDYTQCLAFDNENILWVGTERGLSLYNGRSFTKFSVADGLPDMNITALHVDRQGNTWIGARHKGLVALRYEHRQQLQNAGNIDKAMVKDRFKLLDASNGFLGNRVECIIQDDKNRIWVASDAGLNVFYVSEGWFRKPEFPAVMLDTRESEKKIRSLYQDKNGNIWLGTYGNGVFMLPYGQSLTQESFLHFDQRNGLSNNFVLSITSDGEGNIWFGTDGGGLSRISPKASLKALPESNEVPLLFTRFTDQNGLSHNRIKKVLKDNTGTLWIATNGGGICKFLGETFAHFTETEGVIDNNVSVIYQDKLNSMWIGTSRGVTRIVLPTGKWDSHTYLSYDNNNGFTNYPVTGILGDKRGNIWLTTAGKGAFVIPFTYLSKSKHERSIQLREWEVPPFIRITEEDGLCSNEINAVYQDKKGNIWFGSNGQGVSMLAYEDIDIYRFKSSRYRERELPFASLMLQKGIAGNKIWSIVEDEDDAIWFSTSAGVAQITAEGIKNFSADEGYVNYYSRRNGLSSNRVRPMYFDGWELWMGTLGGGINKFDGDKFSYISKEEGLLSNNVKLMHFEDAFNLWVGTENGADRISLSESYEVKSIRHFGKEEGFSGVETNVNAVFKDNQGDIWFGTVKGATVYHPNKLVSSTVDPKTNITGLRITYENVNWLEYTDSVIPWSNLPADLELAYDKNHLTFDFIGINLRNQDRVEYSWKLTGFDREWSPASTTHSATYSNLPPGEYVFEVKSANEEKVWNSEPVSFTFSIAPPFWQEPWFYLSGFIVVSGLIFGFIKFREKQLKQENIVLEKKVEERTKELAKANKKLSHENEVVEIQNQIIAKKNKDMTTSVQYASMIQQAILPLKDELKRYLPKSFIFFRPRDIVSGDFYWFHQIEDKILVAAVDCTGHGVPGAFVSLIGNDLLNDIIKNKRITDPAEILEALHNGLIAKLKKEEVDVATMWGMDVALCSIEIKKNLVNFSSTGRPLLLVRDGTYQITKMAKRPIGLILKNKIEYKTEKIALRNKDTFYIFSDGYCDQFGGVDGEKYNAGRFYDQLVEIQGKSMKDQEKMLEKAINDWQQDQAQVDDMLIIGMQI